MADFYLNLPVANLTIAGIAFAALLALQQSTGGAVGDKAASRVWRVPRVRRALVWMAANAWFCLAAALALSGAAGASAADGGAAQRRGDRALSDLGLRARR